MLSWGFATDMQKHASALWNLARLYHHHETKGACKI